MARSWLAPHLTSARQFGRFWSETAAPLSLLDVCFWGNSSRRAYEAARQLMAHHVTVGATSVRSIG
jgi:hypothetical protein